jgi:antitoxin component YwqK of YwqJK toxin-antitoxin module
MIKNLLTLISFIFFILSVKSQNTVGVISNSSGVYNGYTLFTSQTETYLINNCGEVINQWSSNYPPGNAVYLLEDGSLLRACKINNSVINFGGTGGRIEKYDWDGNLIFEYNYSDNTKNQHHDIYPMPNGNILVLAATIMSNSEAIQAGRNPDNLVDGNLFNEQIIELQPTGSNSANIVWEWNINEHLIQDFDATKDNFGDVANNPQKLDVNYLSDFSGINNWLHINSIQFNESLNQIIMSSRHLNEIYIIDHSTTTEQAATSTGGVYGKGGDFLYRWGNPQSYRRGTINDRQLFGQHNPYWIPDGLEDEGKIMLFNNGFGRTPSFSEVYTLSLPETTPGVYNYINGTAFGPKNPDEIYSDGLNFFSRILSSAQRLLNGNTLICDGDSGYFFEIDSNNEIVWEYINPSSDSGILSQGNNPDDFPNIVFRATKYALDYPAFEGRDLTPETPIELNSEINTPCTVLSIDEYTLNNLKLSPNPTSSIVTVETDSNITKIEVYNILGSKINTVLNSNSVNLSNYESGMYLLKLFSDESTITKRVIKN